jgi:hypothetical protein
MRSALQCQGLCQNFAAANGRACEYFSYEWEEFPNFEVVSGIFQGESQELDWLLVSGQDIVCESRDIWLSGNCVRCEDGLHPNDRQDRCVECPPNSVPNSDYDGCVCTKGFYDALSATVVLAHEPEDLIQPEVVLPLFHLYCWRHNLQADPIGEARPAERLNEASEAALQNLHKTPLRLSESGYVPTDMNTARCVPCPDCIRCGSDHAGRSLADWRTTASPVITVKPGYGLAAPAEAVSRTSGKVDIIRCPANSSCLSFNVLIPPAERVGTMCAEGHDEAGPLCAVCLDGFVRNPFDRLCRGCAEFSPTSVVTVSVLALAVVMAVLVSLCTRTGAGHRAKVGLWVAIMRLAWPRFKQSLAILVTNFQIVSNVGDNAAIEFPAFFSDIMDALGSVVNVDVLNLPGLSCMLGNSFLRKFAAKMLMPGLLLLLVKLVCRVHLHRIRTKVPGDRNAIFPRSILI